MQKVYKPTILYIIKIFGLIVFLAFTLGVISIFFDLFNYFLHSSVFELSIMIIAGALLVIGSYFIVISNNPIIKLEDKRMTIGHYTIDFENIKTFSGSKGGSEPFLITKDNDRIDLQLSWFSKKDQDEIAQLLQEKIQLNRG